MGVKERLQPRKELLDKVMSVADAKAQLPLPERHSLNVRGVYCRVNRLPHGAFFYQAGGRFIARLRFTVSEDGSITIRKYEPGDWESKVDLAYRVSRRLQEAFAIARETADCANLVEVAKRLEKIKGRYADSAFFYFVLSMAYLDTGQYQQVLDPVVASLNLGLDEPEYEEHALVMLVQIVEEGGSAIDIQRVAQKIEEVAVQRAKSAIAWSVLGRIYLYIGKFKDAESVSTKAVALDPSSALCHYNLSAIYSMACYNAKNPELFSESPIEKLRQLTHGLRLDKLQRADPSLYKAIVEGEEPRDDKRLQGLTPEALGHSYESARHLAEKHTREVIRLSKAEEEILNKAAREQLVTLRMTDKM